MSWENIFKWLMLNKPKKDVRGTVVVEPIAAGEAPVRAGPTKKSKKTVKGAAASAPKTIGEEPDRSKPPKKLSVRGEPAREKRKIKEWQTQFDDVSEKAGDVVITIGLDFGTAFTKVVIDGEIQKYGVPLNDNKQGIGKYLLPTCLYEDTEGYFTIVKPENCCSSHTDLKMRILNKSLNAEKRSHIVNYLALVLQKSRHWLMTEKYDVFANRKIIWAVNVGLPTERYMDEDEKLNEIYSDIVGEAWSRSTVTGVPGKCDGAPDLAGRGLHPDLIGAFPEFVAQIQSYVSSTQQKPGTHILVDVGAGTIDATIFNVLVPNEDGRYPVLGSSVKYKGVIFLIDHRCSVSGKHGNWNPGMQDVMPSLDEFARNLGVTTKDIDNADEEFKYEVRIQIRQLYSVAYKKFRGNSDWETEVPLMLCGGGARVGLYQDAVDKLVQKNPHNHLQKLDFPPLDGLDVPGASAQDMDRLSVAHGLSFRKLEIGEIVMADSIPLKADKPNRGKITCPICRGWSNVYPNCPKCRGEGCIDE